MNLKKTFLMLAFIAIALPQSYGQMTILSGPEQGSYYRFANDMVTVLNAKSGVKLINRATGGSGYNFKMLTNASSGDKIAFIQEDYLNLMIAKDKLNNTNLTGSLKVIMPLAKEEIHIIAKKSSGLTQMQDLYHKKVGVGDEDQGTMATAKLIEERSNIDWYDYNVNFKEMLKKLADGSLDAGIFVGSAPIKLLDIDPQIMVDGITLFELSDFNGWAKFYENDTIYKEQYKWLDKDVPTFGVRTLLVVNEAKLNGDEKKTVESLKSGIAQNLGELRKIGHPQWKTVLIPDDVKTDVQVDDSQSNTSSGNGAGSVVYKVQLYSRSYERQNETINLGGKTYNAFVYLYKGAYRYTIGEFANYNDAIALQKVCRQEGYPEAFVAAFKGNVRSTDPQLFK